MKIAKFPRTFIYFEDTIYLRGIRLQAFNTEKSLQETFLKLKRFPNVIGIDGELQPKITKGKIVKDRMSIRVYVKEKISLDKFKKRGIFGRGLSLQDLIPSIINGIPVDVVEMGEAHSLVIEEPSTQRSIMPRQTTQRRYRPLQAGISATHYQSTACTLNCLYREKSTGKLLLSSNAHCFSRENTAKIGDPILNPSPYDGGLVPYDMIGEFYKGVEIKYGSFKSRIRNAFHKISRTFRSQEAFFNRVDISFATLKCTCDKECNPIKYKCGIKVYGIGLPIGKRLPDLNQRVMKVGRTTGKTIGTVVSTSWTGTVKYSRGSATFIDCILISGKNFSLGGDSGAPCLDMNGNYFGTLFAGSGNHTIVCKYTNIESEGNVELIILQPEIVIEPRKKKRKK